MLRLNVVRMKKIPSLTFLIFFVIVISSCAEESEYTSNLPKIDGFEVKKIYRLNKKTVMWFYKWVRDINLFQKNMRRISVIKRKEKKSITLKI